jgi:hypothetical protein
VTADSISRDFSSSKGHNARLSLADATHIRLDVNFFYTLQTVAKFKLPPAIEPHLVAIRLLRSGV